MRAAAAAFATVTSGLWSCDSQNGKRAGIAPALAPSSSAVASAEQSAPSAAATGAAAPSAAARPFDGPGWDTVRLVDAIPLCVFSDHEARGDALVLKDVHRQKLSAGTKIVFGTFAPGCVAEECDAIPTETCWVDNETPQTLVVHSLLSFRHKHGSTCTADCRPIVAGCETPSPLAPGNYTVKYGARTFSLRVPSVVNTPCFDLR